MEHLGHLLQFDGMLHWCFLLALFGFLISLSWVIIRVLLPLRQLVKLAEGIAEGDFDTFARPIGGIREIDRLRARLHQMLQQLQAGQEREYAYRNALTDSQEHERMRIAHEIHDDTIQSLVLVAHHLERASLAAASEQDALPTHLKNARTQLLTSIDRLRGLIANLRPTILDEMGLVMAVEALCEAHTSLEFQVLGNACELQPAQELALFRTAQEAIRNAERYAQAGQINATLIYSETDVTLRVRDDGVGFEVPKQLQEFAAKGHYGLLGIRERVRHLGGSLSLSSHAKTGTEIEVRFPFEIANSAMKA